MQKTLFQFLADRQPKGRQEFPAFLSCTPDEAMRQLTKLAESGVPIAHYDDDTFALISPLSPLNEEKIANALPKWQVNYFPVIDSTNEYLLKNAKNLPNRVICLTEFQSAGRGRRNRAWLAPFAGQLIMSLFCQLDGKVSLEGLSSVVGLAIVQALNAQEMYGFQVKWPNDIVVNERKLAGVLVEIAPMREGKHQIVIGLGMNIALENEERINQPYAELVDFYPLSEINREDLIIQLAKTIDEYLTRFAQFGIDAQIQQEWLEHDAFLSCEVNVIKENETLSGIAKGIDERGFLVTEINGEIVKFNSADVSLRRK